VARWGGGLLHRVVGHAADPGRGVRPALRIRHLSAGDRERLPGRTAGPLAGSARSLGSGPAAGNGPGAARLLLPSGKRRPPGRSWPPHSLARCAPRPPGGWLWRPPHQHPSALGGPLTPTLRPPPTPLPPPPLP